MEYYFLDKTDLLTNDSSLSLGWFKIDELEVVRDRYCMVTISFSDLIEGLLSLNNKKIKLFKWSPCDSGDVITLQKKKDKVIINYKSNEIIKNFNDFYKEVIKACTELIVELKSYRMEVENESAFIDLVQMTTLKC